MRPETMARLGLTYEDCRAVNPRLVYCGCFGFHQDGPYADKAAYDDVIQGMSGLAAIQAMTTGEPRYLPTVAVDKTVGIRSEEHTSELQSLMRISYAVFCLKKKK